MTVPRNTSGHSDEIKALPTLLTPRQAASLLRIGVHALPYLGLASIPVETRGRGARRHVRYRLVDVLKHVPFASTHPSA
jgi:hypothetical protein